MTITKLQKDQIKANKAVVLTKIERFEDISFAHILMAEEILYHLALDDRIIMEAVAKRRKIKAELAKLPEGYR